MIKFTHVILCIYGLRLAKHGFKIIMQIFYSHLTVNVLAFPCCFFLTVDLILFQNFLVFDLAKLLMRSLSLILKSCLAFFVIRLNRVRARVKFLRDSSVRDLLKLFRAVLKSRCCEAHSLLNQSLCTFFRCVV